MPLAERDINTEAELPRTKRHAQRDHALARGKDESSPPTMKSSDGPKATPPSQRLLSATKASAARATPPPRQPGLHTTPRPSRIPRRSPAPRSVKANPRVLTNAADLQTAATEARPMSDLLLSVDQTVSHLYRSPLDPR
jgi:hypothetical protein